MEETKSTLTAGEGEETIISPRFDDEETVLARPVVPLEEVGDAPAASHASTSSHAATPLYSRLRGAPRRSLVAALVLVSALVGSVLGVAGLYFYQKQRSAPATQQQQADKVQTPAAAQPVTEPAPAAQSRETDAPAAAEPSIPAPAEVRSDAQAKDESDSAKRDGEEEAAARPAAERRSVSETGESVVNTKRGKKGSRDEEIQRGAQRAPRYDEDDRPVVRGDDSDDDRREARRVGVITYRPRRVRRQRDSYGGPDRLRRIFEGQP
jgi:hypothetical protein